MLSGIACGMLATAAAFGAAGPLHGRRLAVQRGAQMAGLVGTAVLVSAFVAYALQVAGWPSFFDPVGRSLGIASIGLLVAWASLLRHASTASMEAGMWGTLGLAAALSAWAQFAPEHPAAPDPLSPLVGLLLLAAGGLVVPAWGQAVARLADKGHACPPPRVAGKRSFYLSGAVALVLLAMLILSARAFSMRGTLWPSGGFKALAGVWLILFSARLVEGRPAGAVLSAVGELALIVCLLASDIWGA